MKSLKGLTQQNQLNAVVFCVSPHFVDMDKSIEMLSLAKKLVKLPNFVKRNKVVVTNKRKGLVSVSQKLKGFMCTFWTKKNDDLLMKKTRNCPLNGVQSLLFSGGQHNPAWIDINLKFLSFCLFYGKKWDLIL
ncbi:hypothetical protein RDI58_027658 [Solanum bulbocastanum]|uniref:Uncharacterized protein n=1 Tax=Solanum bulbocastanum TaxID=147425 RepID=A0AAN8T141_SOLBU